MRKARNTFRSWRQGFEPEFEKLATERDVVRFLERPNSRRVWFGCKFFGFVDGISQETFRKWMHIPTISSKVLGYAPLSAQTINDEIRYICADPDGYGARLLVCNDLVNHIYAEDLEHILSALDRWDAAGCGDFEIDYLKNKPFPSQTYPYSDSWENEKAKEQIPPTSWQKHV